MTDIYLITAKGKLIGVALNIQAAAKIAGEGCVIRSMSESELRRYFPYGYKLAMDMLKKQQDKSDG